MLRNMFNKYIKKDHKFAIVKTSLALVLLKLFTIQTFTYKND